MELYMFLPLRNGQVLTTLPPPLPPQKKKTVIEWNEWNEEKRKKSRKMANPEKHASIIRRTHYNVS